VTAWCDGRTLTWHTACGQMRWPRH
jgi:hypothetical protein